MRAVGSDGRRIVGVGRTGEKERILTRAKDEELADLVAKALGLRTGSQRDERAKHKKNAASHKSPRTGMQRSEG